jgi:hypothetical protein
MSMGSLAKLYSEFRLAVAGHATGEAPGARVARIGLATVRRTDSLRHRLPQPEISR